MTKNVRRGFTSAFSCVIAALGLLAATPDASAARAYNFTNKTIRISALYNTEIDLRAGQRSESLNWSEAIIVYHPNSTRKRERGQGQVCYFGGEINAAGITLKGANWLKGGNYLVVVQHGTKVSCTICDASKRNIKQDSGRVTAGNEYTTPNRPDHGCK